MKTITKIKILKRLHLFNLARDCFYRFSGSSKKYAAFYKQFIHKGDLCFDVGANVGQKTDVFLKLGARVVAVEPQHDCAQYLRRKYRDNPRVTLIEKGLDKQDGEREIFLCEANALSTMSTDWIEATKESGRSQGFSWEEKTVIKTTRLDQLIMAHGKPKFCKIDVEGYEFNVIQGLTQKIPYISLEVTPESMANIIRCMDHLSRLGQVEWNHCAWDRSDLTFPQWLPKDDFITTLKAKNDAALTGDIYSHFIDAPKT